MHIHGILLAAGESKRFKGIKQLAQLTHSKTNKYIANNTLINRSCLQVLGANFQSCHLILGANASDIMPSIPGDMSYKVAQNWSNGMGATIGEAMHYCPQQATHVCIMLADQIKLDAKHYNQLIQKAKALPNQIVAAHFNQRLAAPCIFPRDDFNTLKGLRGDAGARAFLLQESHRVVRLALPEAAVDIDTREDLDKWDSC